MGRWKDMSKKDLDTLLDEALNNIRNDRKVAREFLNEVANQIETLQRSNEQLVKIIALTQKRQTKDVLLSDDEKNELFDMLQQSEQ